MTRRSKAAADSPAMAPMALEGAKRTQIIQALVNCVAEHGFERTTIRAIAERAGVSPGLLTYYFKDKKGLVRIAIESALAAILRSTEQASVSFGPDRLRLVLTRYLRDGYPGALPLGFWLQIQAAAATDESIRSQVTGWMLDGRARTVNSVAAAIESGQFSDALDPELTGRLVYAVMTGLAVTLSVSAELSTPDEAIATSELLIELLLGWDVDANDREIRHLDTANRVRHMLARDPRLTQDKAARLATAFEAMYQIAVDG